MGLGSVCGSCGVRKCSLYNIYALPPGKSIDKLQSEEKRQYFVITCCFFTRYEEVSRICLDGSFWKDRKYWKLEYEKV